MLPQSFFDELAVKKKCFCQSRKAWPLNATNICFRSLSQSLPLMNFLLLPPMATALHCMSLALELHVMYVCLWWSLYEFCPVWFAYCCLVWSALRGEVCLLLFGMSLPVAVWSGLHVVVSCCAVRGGEGRHTSHQFNFKLAGAKGIWMMRYPPISFSIPGMQISVHRLAYTARIRINMNLYFMHWSFLKPSHGWFLIWICNFHPLIFFWNLPTDVGLA